MDLLHPALPILLLLAGAGALTLAKYRVAPLTWSLSPQFVRYGLLQVAGLLTMVYWLLRSTLPAPLSAGHARIIGALEILFLGLGVGFLVDGLQLMFRRSGQ